MAKPASRSTSSLLMDRRKTLGITPESSSFTMGRDSDGGRRRHDQTPDLYPISPFVGFGAVKVFSEDLSMNPHGLLA